MNFNAPCMAPSLPRDKTKPTQLQTSLTSTSNTVQYNVLQDGLVAHNGLGI